MTYLETKQLGKYKIKESLGQGAMAEVYRAFQPGLERDVAIKIIRANLVSDPDFLDRFKSEAKIVAALRHPGIVQIYDFDVQDNVPYMVIELVSGQTLKEYLFTLQQHDEPMPLPKALLLFKAMLKAVAYAHKQGVVHRDLKPANVLLNSDEQPILADFGLSKIMDVERQIDSGAILGTPTYISPEQGAGQSGDERSDIYSLGVMLYEMTTGIPPFVDGSPITLILKHLDEPLPPPRLINAAIPEPVEHIIQKALEKEPANRYQSTQELLDALNEVSLSKHTPLPDQTISHDTRCPYRGLQAFEPRHAEFYFGREMLVNQLVDMLAPNGGSDNAVTARSPRFLAVLGASGSGKSSLVRAGLIPALQQNATPNSHKWQPHLMTPGSRPLNELAALLHHALFTQTKKTDARLKEKLQLDGRTLHLAVKHTWSDAPLEQHLLLIVDQFEELFTLCHNQTERRAFIENLLYASAVAGGRVIVVVTMRADFYHRCVVYRDLARRISNRQILVGQMDEPELRRAIEQPAHRVGLKFEPGLVDVILADVARQPGALPLLQHALLELWEQRQEHLLILSAYQASGGVTGAIAQRADSLYDTFNPQEQHIVKRIMLRLTQPGEGTEDTRRRARWHELLPNDPRHLEITKNVLQQLVDARLLTTSRDSATSDEVVDVAHEALIRGWGRLQSWLDEDRAALLIHRQMTEAVEAWNHNNRDPSYLYQGARLAQALEWAELHGDHLNDAEQSFLKASRNMAEANEREKEVVRQRELAQAQALAKEQRHRAEVQARASKWLRWLAVGLAVIFIFTVGVATFAIQQWQKAQQQTQTAILAQNAAETERNRAEQQAQAAVLAQNTAENERSRAEQQADLALSRQLVAQSAALVDEQLDLAVLLTLEAGQVVSNSHTPGSIPVIDLTFSPNLKTFLHGHTDFTNAVAFSPDGSTLVSASDDKTLIVWDLATNQPIGFPLAGHIDQIWSVDFSPDGKTLASSARDRLIILWNATTGQRIGLPLVGHTDIVADVAFSPNGKLLASAGHDRTIRLWDVATGQQLTSPLTGHTEDVNSVAFSPDGNLLVSGSSDRTVRLWNVATGRPVGRPLTGHTNNITAVAFSPDGKMLASGSNDHSIIIWNIENDTPTATRLTGHNDLVQTVAFSPDGKMLASGSKDKTIRLWTTDTGQLAGPPITSLEWVRDIAFSPNGQLLASAGDHVHALLWHVNTAKLLTGHNEWVNSVAFSPDGNLLVSGSDDNTVAMWDVPNRQRRGTPLREHTDHVLTVAYSPDGRVIASAGNDQKIILWDASTHRPLGQPLTGHSSWISSLDFSINNNTLLLASSSADRTIRLWDVEQAQPFGPSLIGHSDTVLKTVFSPNGRLLASSSSDNTIILWDINTGRPMTLPLTAHTDNVWGLAFSPDGKILASSGDDDTIILWDTETWQPLGPPLTGHTNDVWGVTFSPDGKILASASRDNTIILWDVTSQQPLAPPLTGHKNWIWGIDFSPNGSTIASGGRAGDIILWQVNTAPDLPTHLCGLANRNLTTAEWNHYLPEKTYKKTCPYLLPDLPLLHEGLQLAQSGNIQEAVTQIERVLIDNPDLTLNAKDAAHQARAMAIVEEAREIAHSGNPDEAAAKYSDALTLNPSLQINPQTEANYWAALALLKQGQDSAGNANIDEAIANFTQALALNPDLPLTPKAGATRLAAESLVTQGETLMIEGHTEEALQVLTEARSLDPTLKISARTWHTVCRFGALAQKSAMVADACNQAVKLAPDDGWVRDSRGLVRALEGDYSGAIEDFQFFINWFIDDPRFGQIGLKRERWIMDLESGQNPITTETLVAIQEE